MPDSRSRFRLSVPVPTLGVVALISLTFACSSKPATPPPTAVSADTWATVDGRAITSGDVDKAFRRGRDSSQPMSGEEALLAKLGVLNDLIVQDILLAKAAALKIDVPAAELDTAYTDATKNLAADAYQQELSKRNLSAADMREGLRRELLTQKVIAQEVGAKVLISDKEVSDFFESHRAQFSVPEESYRIAQIVVTPGNQPAVNNRTGDDATSPAAADAKIKMLGERLKAGATFQDLAVGYSEDPDSAQRGGDLGLVPLSKLKQAPPQLREAVLNKEPGTVSVVSAGGAHTMVLVIAHEQAGQRDLSTPAVKDGITQTLREHKEQLLRSAYLTSAQTDAAIVNYLARRLVESNGVMPTLLAAPPSGTATQSK